MSANPEGDTCEYEGKQKELELIYNPVMQKAYQGANPGDSRGQQYQQGEYQQQPTNSGPSADEVD